MAVDPDAARQLFLDALAAAASAARIARDAGCDAEELTGEFCETATEWNDAARLQ